MSRNSLRQTLLPDTLNRLAEEPGLSVLLGIEAGALTDLSSLMAAALTACLSSGGPRNAHLEGDCYPGTASIDEEGITFNALPETAILAILQNFEPGMAARSLIDISGFPDLRIKRVVLLEMISGPRMLRCVFEDNKPPNQRLEQALAAILDL